LEGGRDEVASGDGAGYDGDEVARCGVVTDVWTGEGGTGWLEKVDLRHERSGNGCTLLDKVELIYES
jgi:hypothetical protein